MSPAGSEIRGENAQFGRPSAGLVGGGEENGISNSRGRLGTLGGNVPGCSREIK